jgi:hypothetical protein
MMDEYERRGNYALMDLFNVENTKFIALCRYSFYHEFEMPTFLVLPSKSLLEGRA